MSSQVLKHRGQIGSLEHDLERDCLYGKLLFIDDLVTYEADTVPNLKREFIVSVDEYLADCEELGIEPSRPLKGSFNVRVGTDLHRKMAFCAAENGIGLNDLVVEAVTSYISGHNGVIQHVHDHMHTHTIRDTKEISYGQPAMGESRDTSFKVVYRADAPRKAECH